MVSVVLRIKTYLVRERSSTRAMLLDGYALREISRLVDVAAAADGNVIRKQLERDHLEKRQQQLTSDGNCDEVVGHFGNFFVTFAGNRYHDAAARFDLLDVG